MTPRYFLLIPVMTICVIFYSCVQDVNLTCKSGTFNTTLIEDSFANKEFEEFRSLPQPDIIYYQYFGEKAVFSYGLTVGNICPGELVEITYEMTTSALDQTPGSRINSVASWEYSNQGHLSGTTQSGTIAYDITPSTSYRDTFKIDDISEVFGEFEAQIEVYLSVEFDKLPTFEADRAYFVNHFSSMKITVTADRFL
jgi:hypothetical protein